MADFRKFQAFHGGAELWINLDTVTHAAANQDGAVTLYLTSGAQLLVQGGLEAIMRDLSPSAPDRGSWQKARP